MDPEVKHTAEENLKLLKENNKLLKKLVRHQRWSSIMRVLYWILFVALTLAAYYYVQPYLENLMEVYSGAQDRLEMFGI